MKNITSLFCLLLLAAPMARAQVEVYFTRPVDTTLASTAENRARYEPDVAQLVARLIANADESVDMAMYNLNVQPVVDALIAAHRRGVWVRVIANVEHVSSPSSRFAQLAAVGIPIIANPRVASGEIQPLMHNKFLILDGRPGSSNAPPTVVTGSWNATFTQTYEDANNIVVIRDSAVAGAYRAEFEEMWGSKHNSPVPSSARFGADKTDSTEHVFTLADGTRIDVYFSPSDGTESKIRDAIATAQTSLFAATLTFTSRVLPHQLNTQKTSGADVRVLIENVDDEGSQFGALSAKVETHSTATVPGQLHHKYAIVDATPIAGGSNPIVVTGSHNWTYTANSFNDENIVIIHSAAIANQYLQEFAARYREAGGVRSFGVPSATDESASSGDDETLGLYPNPFESVISLSHPLRCDADVTLVDLLGRIVWRGVLGAGDRVITLDARAPIEGAHLLRIIGCGGRTTVIPVTRAR